MRSQRAKSLLEFSRRAPRGRSEIPARAVRRGSAVHRERRGPKGAAGPGPSGRARAAGGGGGGRGGRGGRREAGAGGARGGRLPPAGGVAPPPVVGRGQQTPRVALGESGGKGW